MARDIALTALAELELSGPPCHEPCHAVGAVSRQAHAAERGSRDRPAAGPAGHGQPGPPGADAGFACSIGDSFAIGRRKVTITDRN
jgi:hypothetical protein